MTTIAERTAVHARAAARARRKPGRWVFVKKYSTTASAQAATSFVRNGKFKSFPRGEFEARQSGEGRVNVSIRLAP